MTRRKKSDDLVCNKCGQEIHEDHFMHIRITKDGKTLYEHSVCKEGLNEDGKEAK